VLIGKMIAVVRSTSFSPPSLRQSRIPRTFSQPLRGSCTGCAAAGSGPSIASKRGTARGTGRWRWRRARAVGGEPIRPIDDRAVTPALLVEPAQAVAAGAAALRALGHDHVELADEVARGE